MKAIYAQSRLNGELFIFNTTTNGWDMCANVSESHPRYEADSSDLGRAIQAAEATQLGDVALVDSGTDEPEPVRDHSQATERTAQGLNDMLNSKL